MNVPAKTQRIRDPLHDLIPFGSDRFERMLWDVIQTRPFQRLRRVRQLGFSEYTFPGATHSRFAHSLGVFHTARRLMGVIRRHLGEENLDRSREEHALAAALVHDVGHGMFSHAFEDVGARLGLALAKHEKVSDLLIRQGDIAEVFRKGQGSSSFADDVATLIGNERPGSLYDAVVSSQFDADRLDYMRRDSLMTGVRNSMIDFEWLVANLEIADIPLGEDEDEGGTIQTFVLGPKAEQAAENYVLSLFHLYPNVYFHKATRAAEKVFTELMIRIVSLVRDGSDVQTGLPKNHPFLLFAHDPENIECVLNLDDSVLWGALPMLALAPDTDVKNLSQSLANRRLPKCVDVRLRLDQERPACRAASRGEQAERRQWVARTLGLIESQIEEWNHGHATHVPRILIDQGNRPCYKKRFQGSKGPLNQIHMRTASGGVVDIEAVSPVAAAVDDFRFYRAYVFRDDTDAKDAVEAIIKTSIGETGA